MEDLTGQQFGAYQIVAPLGEGGMAAVYKAYQPAVDRYVAIKVLPRQYAADPDFTARFEREAKLLARLQHPHILPIFDYGQASGYTYLVMPFVPSGTLTDLLKGQPLPLLQVRRLITQIGEALAYAHAHGLIHRDVKPSNVLLDESGNCLLSDFGLARMAEGSLKLTMTGAVLGTPAYMSPEQGMGHVLDGRSDVYALGVILYEAIAGRVPYRAETPVAVIFKHISDPLPPARELNPDIPEPVERVLLKALAKRPEDRFQTAAEMVAAIQAAIPEGGQPTALPPPPSSQPATLVAPASQPPVAPPVTPKPGLPGWTWFALGLGLVAIVGAAALAALWPLLYPLEPPLIVITATLPPEVASPLPPSPTVALPTATLPPPTTPPIEAPPPTRFAAKDGMPQVFVPAGEFRFGSDFSAQTLPAFWMDQTEVTNAMYARCVSEGACRPPAGKASETRGAYYGNTTFDSYPVVYVDWSDADAYCRWAGRRLPTEAEWEKAARGVNGWKYAWGEAAPQPDVANYGRLVGDTTLAGAYPGGASPYGALDMIGNVAEWVDAWQSEGYRSLKGGSWVTDADGLKAWGRFGSRPTNRYADYGFRCVEAETDAAATSTAAPGATRVLELDGMAQVFVPAGEFNLGLSEAERAVLLNLCPGCLPDYLNDTSPQRRITLDSFWIDQTEVTNAQFARFVAATGYQTIAEQKQDSYIYDASLDDFRYVPDANWRTPQGAGSSVVGRDSVAVTQISWVDAAAYCQWAGRRLPTEAEWEKAARGADGRVYPWGNNPPDATRLNFDLQHTGPVSVGGYPAGASPYGALDMAGNVWEWTADFYSETYYQTAPANNPAGPTTGEGHTFRGGSWASTQELKVFLVSAVGRLWNKPELRSDVLGFRCVSAP